MLLLLLPPLPSNQFFFWGDSGWANKCYYHKTGYFVYSTWDKMYHHHNGIPGTHNCYYQLVISVPPPPPPLSLSLSLFLCLFICLVWLQYPLSVRIMIYLLYMMWMLLLCLAMALAIHTISQRASSMYPSSTQGHTKLIRINCAYLVNKIYCYGGSIAGDTSNNLSYFLSWNW